MVAWKVMYYWAPVNNATIYIAMFLRYLVLMNVSLAVFNLIPVPPLDGSRILLVVLPQRIYFGLMRYERYIMIALLAAVGHALRFCLMNCAGMDIATASLCAATAIGFGSLWLGKAIRCPMTALYIPALLPMVPGIYAYKTVFSLIMFLQSLNDPGEGLQYMQQFFLNATVSLSVIALLAAGATLPIFVFNHQAFSLTRRRKHTDK